MFDLHNPAAEATTVEDIDAASKTPGQLGREEIIMMVIDNAPTQQTEPAIKKKQDDLSFVSEDASKSMQTEPETRKKQNILAELKRICKKTLHT